MPKETVAALKQIQENPVSDDPQFPGVTDIPLHCRAIRVGSFNISSKTCNSLLKVFLAVDGISFSVPLVLDASKMVNITLKPCDVTQLFFQFASCLLETLFVFTTPSFGENIRKLLNMTSPENSYYDPTYKDETVNKIVFLIDSINEEQKRFLRCSFLNEKKVKELDLKTANELMVKSYRSQGPNVRREVTLPIHHIDFPQGQNVRYEVALPTRVAISVPATQIPVSQEEGLNTTVNKTPPLNHAVTSKEARPLFRKRKQDVPSSAFTANAVTQQAELKIEAIEQEIKFRRLEHKFKEEEHAKKMEILKTQSCIMKTILEKLGKFPVTDNNGNMLPTLFSFTDSL